MDQTLHDLGELLIKAIPTIVFFVILTFYLKAVFFKPIARILEERRRQTEGVRDLALQALAAADAKNSEFERALDLARAQIWEEHDALRRQWEQEQDREIAQACTASHAKLVAAREQIATDAREAELELQMQVDSLSQRIVDTLLNRRAA